MLEAAHASEPFAVAAPRPMKMGTIAAPWRYDATRDDFILRVGALLCRNCVPFDC
jgi:hypothetical protein